jgi:TonB family protein
MSVKPYPGRSNFGLLPEPERSTGSFITSATINLIALAIVLYIGMTARRVIQQHQYEQTVLVIPANEPPKPEVKVEQPKVEIQPPPPEVMKQFDAPKITAPVAEPKPDKQIQIETRQQAPQIKSAAPQVVLAPQPHAVLGAAMPAQTPQAKVSTAPVHLGSTFGVTPNPNATRPATVAAIGNPYGGMSGKAVAPHGIVGSTGFGNGTKFGSSAGVQGKVASAGVPGGTGTAHNGNAYGNAKVASAGIPKATAASAPMPMAHQQVASTNLEVLSKPPVRYTQEARQMRVQGDVILRVTFTASGQVVVQGVVHGLGHGLDEEARRVAAQIRFRPATRNGQAVDMTTNITITFQLA